MFYDRAKINVRAGNGGDGSASFRREKYAPKGGPDGGDGGRGGSVYLRVEPSMNTLLAFHYKQHFKAQPGGSGRSNQRHGKAADDLYIDVPPGTYAEVIDEDPVPGSPVEVVQADLLRPGQTLMVARGGRGGLGNVHFATSTHQAPRFAEKGEPGQERTVTLELKIIADVGLLGYPNVGKSTLLSVASAAQPKIADYPFTTLQPMLGVVRVDDDTFVMADIPGLIEGASSGAGLGLEFLRHVERTRLLLHVVDGSAGLWWDAAPEAEGKTHPSQTTDPIEDFKRINAELEQYDPTMSTKPQIIAINKIDLQEVRDRLPELMERFREMGYEDVYPISAATGQGVQELLGAVAAKLHELPRPEWEEPERAEEEEEVVVPTRHVAAESQRFDITQESDSRFRVSGERIERLVSMTDMGNPFALERMQRELDRMGISDALRAAGVETGDMVAIGRIELEWTNEPWRAYVQTMPRREKKGPGKKHS
jgi:GTP-binding protein